LRYGQKKGGKRKGKRGSQCQIQTRGRANDGRRKFAVFSAQGGAEKKKENEK